MKKIIQICEVDKKLYGLNNEGELYEWREYLRDHLVTEGQKVLVREWKKLPEQQ